MLRIGTIALAPLVKGNIRMKINKTQLRRLIAEERAKLVREQAGTPEGSRRIVPVDGETIGQMPSELEEQLAMEMQYYFQEAIEAEEYDGTGPTWDKEIMSASNAFYQALVDSGALKSVLELWRDVEDGLHNGEYYSG